MKLVRHYRPEEALADTIKPVMRGSRDAQRATGTEKAQTMLVAETALEAADAASETANGKSTVVRSTSPATGAGSYKQGDQWWQFSGANIVGLWLHSGTDWVEQALTNAIIATLDAGKITTGTLAADRIGANSITTAKLAATAIDGMTITGALIRTAASGQRMEMDSFGLNAYNNAGEVTARLAPGGEGITVGAPGASPQGSLMNGTLAFQASNSLAARNAVLSFGGVTAADPPRNSKLVGEPEQLYVQRVRKQTGQSDGIEAVSANVSSDVATLLLEHRPPGSPVSSVVQLRAFTDPTDGLTSDVRADIVQADKRAVAPKLLTNTVEAMLPNGDLAFTASGKVSARSGANSRPAFTPVSVQFGATANIANSNSSPNAGTFARTSSALNAPLAMGNELFSPGAHSITVLEDGVYSFDARSSVPVATTGRSFIQFYANGYGEFVGVQEFPVGSYNFTAGMGGPLLAGTVVQFIIYQTTGGTRSITTGVWATWHGPLP